ncbi:MAG: hypothetical protein ACOC2H_05055 [Spirochaetota bacterium]
MISIRNIEVKLGLIMGFSAFFLSPLIGIISDISLPVVLMRTVVLTFVFFGLGYGALFLIRRYVPEFYEVLNTSGSIEERNPEEIDTGMQPETEGGIDDEAESTDAEDYSIGEMPAGRQYAAPEYDSFSSSASSGVEKMGRHILEEKGIKYEPKIMAEAIRTMMSKDEE